MALINNIYVMVIDESVNHDSESSSHPIEDGSEITDHVQAKPTTLTIKGCIVDIVDKDKKTGVSSVISTASDIISKIIKLQKTGSLITYIGRNAESNLQIQSFSTSHPNTIWGGCEFDMTLKAVKIAKLAFDKTAAVQQVSTQQVEKGENENIYHTVKKGDCVWNLVTKQYKSLEPKFSNVMDKCNWVMSQNPNAFSRKGDFRTLQIGKKLLIGYRK